MTGAEADLDALLRAHDDPDHLEFPRGYDRRDHESRLNALAARLGRDFATRCQVVHDTQDSSEYGRVHVPGTATVAEERIVVCVSRHGGLALIAADNPGAYLGVADAHAECALDLGDLARVDRAVRDLGYTPVPEELLERDYHGPHRDRVVSHRPTWWDRYFGTC